MSVPSPADAPRLTARELLREIHRRGGRVYRMPITAVFCLTTDPELAGWLIELGGSPYAPRGYGMHPNHDGSYFRDGRTRKVKEWDIYIHRIPVKGDETVHDAAYHNRKVKLEVVS